MRTLLILVGLLSGPAAPRAQVGIPAPPTWQWKYRQARQAIERRRLELARELREATDATARARVLDRARRFLVREIDRRLFPFWYGTPWNIRGATLQPRKGSIACGTFVATVLEHAGFRVERSLGGTHSVGLMKTFTTPAYLKLMWNWPIERFVRAVRQMGSGLFVVGLDMHVGLLLVKGRRVYFVHSNYRSPAHVLKEDALRSEVLGASRWRMVGRISQDPQVIESWLLGRPLPTWRRPSGSPRQVGQSGRGDRRRASRGDVQAP